MTYLTMAAAILFLLSLIRPKNWVPVWNRIPFLMTLPINIGLIGYELVMYINRNQEAQIIAQWLHDQFHDLGHQSVAIWGAAILAVIIPFVTSIAGSLFMGLFALADMPGNDLDRRNVGARGFLEDPRISEILARSSHESRIGPAEKENPR